ncbi:hypothetical protein JRQ81_012125 [Phrynocephalus forsythii]|uniref:Uncharacterized protein n=1 Tax=Phrynocephalus forsythii TaxID=171643 RepID=A0A9Q0X8I1_9SAUR|nr:hypothetical protein JRQ81_012125 [Phrynocephalus forsythii]
MATRTKKKESPSQATNLLKLIAQDSFKNALQDLQANIVKQISNQMQELKTDLKAGIDSNNLKIDAFTQVVKEVEHTVTKMEKELETLKEEKNKDQERLLMIEMDRASYFLIIQNMEEHEGEDLEQLIIEELATQIGLTKEDRIYRVGNTYTRKNKLPKEVHINQ